jgi:hypothetical protein
MDEENSGNTGFAPQNDGLCGYVRGACFGLPFQMMDNALVSTRPDDPDSPSKKLKHLVELDKTSR